MQKMTPQAKAVALTDTVKYIAISGFFVTLSTGIFLLSAQ